MHVHNQTNTKHHYSVICKYTIHIYLNQMHVRPRCTQTLHIKRAPCIVVVALCELKSSANVNYIYVLRARGGRTRSVYVLHIGRCDAMHSLDAVAVFAYAR